MHKNMNINKFADIDLLNDEIMDSFILLVDINTDKINKVRNSNELSNPSVSNVELQNDDFNDEDMLQTLSSSKLKNDNKIRQEKIVGLKGDLTNLNKKAKFYEKQYNEEVSLINDMSDDDIVLEFAKSFK
jgi:hypothetical protein